MALVKKNLQKEQSGMFGHRIAIGNCTTWLVDGRFWVGWLWGPVTTKMPL